MSAVEVTCPECGTSETVGLMGAIYLSFEADVTITEVNCSECGYEGEA